MAESSRRAPRAGLRRSEHTIAHDITLTRRLADGASPARRGGSPIHLRLRALQDTAGRLIAAAALYAALLLGLRLGQGG